jgi:hypothetical protein
MVRLVTAALCLVVLGHAQGDPGRPVLKRGGPADKREPVQPLPSKSTGGAPAEPEPAPQPPAPASQPRAPRPGAQPGDVEVDADGKVIRDAGALPVQRDLIERARETAYEYSDRLPDFTCDQIVKRFVSKTFKPKWKLEDTVQVELLYLGGKEDYRNIRVNGKPLKKGTLEESGSWSMGEFASVLLDLFSRKTNASFRLKGDSDAAGMAAKLYDFSVLQPNSHWRIRVGREVTPAYKGSVWVDPESARVLRIEMSSRQFPADYEVDTVETTVDYGWVTISNERHLLPVKSETLACVRGSFDCMRNEIEFKNYRKFAVESQVLQVESEVTFPDLEDEKPAQKKGRTEPPSITPKPEAGKKNPPTDR